MSEEKRILLSRLVFSKGLVCVVGTLLEEFLHLEHGLNDCSRSMQNHLIDMLATRMIPLSQRDTVAQPYPGHGQGHTKQAEEAL